MPADDPVPALRQLPAFRALPPDLLQQVADCCRTRTYPAGETVFLEGAPVQAFFAVLQGSVKVFKLSPDGHEQVLHHLRAGQTFAEAAVLSMQRYPASAVAIEPDTRLLVVGAEPFRVLFRTDDRLAGAMVSSLSHWLVGLVERIEELSVASAGERLARFLVRQPSRRVEGHARIELPMAKKELAAHLAIAPETLSRILRRWQDAEVVRSEGRSLTVLDERLFAALADPGAEA
jgi:CRP/FNR family transcriptional regulator